MNRYHRHARRLLALLERLAETHDRMKALPGRLAPADLGDWQQHLDDLFGIRRLADRLHGRVLDNAPPGSPARKPRKLTGRLREPRLAGDLLGRIRVVVGFHDADPDAYLDAIVRPVVGRDWAAVVAAIAAARARHAAGTDKSEGE